MIGKDLRWIDLIKGEFLREKYEEIIERAVAPLL